jgi:hypothetical protein
MFSSGDVILIATEDPCYGLCDVILFLEQVIEGNTIVLQMLRQIG